MPSERLGLLPTFVTSNAEMYITSLPIKSAGYDAGPDGSLIWTCGEGRGGDVARIIPW
jgi:hypothetical protein